MCKISTFWYGVLIILAVIYFYYFIYKKKYSNNENFTPKINSLYRPHIRNMRLKYDHFANNYSTDFIINKLKRMNIY
jgi:hypothetical protein